jgi:hypothetical protein
MRRGVAQLAIGSVLGISPGLATACGGDHAGHRARPPHPGTTRASDSRPPANGPLWTEAQVRRQVSGATIVAAGKRVRIDPTSFACWGDGAARVRRGVRRWRWFTCLAPTFRGAEAGPDVRFVVVPRSTTGFDVLSARLVSY